MSLSLNRWYRIAFPGQPRPVGIFVTVTEDELADPDIDVGVDCFVLELESSADLLVEKVRMTSHGGRTLAVCSNAMGCIEGRVEPIGIQADLYSQLVWSPEICPQKDWMTFDDIAGTTSFSLYFSLLLDPENVQPCDDRQPQAAVATDDPARGTVGAWPMVFAFPGGSNEGGNPGKTIKIIWKKDF